MKIVRRTLSTTAVLSLIFMKISPVFGANVPSTRHGITSNKESSEIIPRDSSSRNADFKSFTGRVTKLQPVTSNYRSASISASTMRLIRLTAVNKPAYVVVPTKVDNKKEDPDGDDIFKELENELNWNSTQTVNFQTEEEEAEESEKIFRSLIGEIENPKLAVALTKGTEKDREMLHKVTEAIARLTLKGKSKSGNNGNVLGIISDFFRSQLQYRS